MSKLSNDKIRWARDDDTFSLWAKIAGLWFEIARVDNNYGNPQGDEEGDWSVRVIASRKFRDEARRRFGWWKTKKEAKRFAESLMVGKILPDARRL